MLPRVFELNQLDAPGSSDKDSALISAHSLGSEPASLRCEGLSKRYGSTLALDGVSFHVHEGEFVTLLGPSGSGKTTTLRLVAGFMRPTSGTIYVADRDITSIPPHRRDIGMVFQNYALFPHMTAAENISFSLRMRKVPRADQRRFVDQALSLVQLEGLGDRYPRELSGGQQQRVAFARAVVFRPRLLLMDEPLGALDKKLREAIQLEIKRLHQELGITVVHVTHDQEEALILSDRIAVFRQGRIEQIGTAAELYERPTSVFVADFLGESNVFRGRLEHEDGQLVVAADGMHFRCGEQAAGERRAGDGAALIVRPERIDMISAEAVTDSTQERKECLVRQAIYLGSSVKYELGVGGRSVFVRQNLNRDRPQFQAGDRAAITWRIEDAILVSDNPESASSQRQSLASAEDRVP
jgi:putative spermidine/putrescine transport system ATP-binding protein